MRAACGGRRASIHDHRSEKAATEVIACTATEVSSVVCLDAQKWSVMVCGCESSKGWYLGIAGYPGEPQIDCTLHACHFEWPAALQPVAPRHAGPFGCACGDGNGVNGHQIARSAAMTWQVLL